MFARKCDRCGRLYENYYDVDGNAVYTFTRNDNGEALDKEVYVKDLCPDCMEDFRNFMDGWYTISHNDYVNFMEYQTGLVEVEE